MPAHPVARDDRADAGSTVGEWDEPEPAALELVAEDDDLDVPLPVSDVAPRAAHLCVEGRPVEPGDAFGVARTVGRHRVAAGRVDDEAPLEHVRRAVRAAHLHAGRPLAVAKDARRAPAFAQLCSAGPRAAEEQLVERVAGNLEGMVPAGVERVREVVAGRPFVVAGIDEARTALQEKAGAHVVEDADGLEHIHAVGQERFAQVKARMVLALEDDDPPSPRRQPRRANRAGGPTPDDDGVEGHSAVFGGGPSWMRSPMYAPMRVRRIPMAAKIR